MPGATSSPVAATVLEPGMVLRDSPVLLCSFYGTHQYSSNPTRLANSGK
jgi:hypothetical protein